MMLKLRLKEILDEQGLTQKALAEMTGLRQNTISEMTKNVRDSINRKHVSLVAEKLGIKNVGELLYFENE